MSGKGRVLQHQTFDIEWTGQEGANNDDARVLLCLLGCFGTFCACQNSTFTARLQESCLGRNAVAKLLLVLLLCNRTLCVLVGRLGLFSTKATALGYFREYEWRSDWPPVHDFIH